MHKYLRSMVGLQRSSQFGTLYLINSANFSFWWIVLNPGFYSSDSIAILEAVSRQIPTSSLTYLWYFLVYLTTLGGSYPQVATLIFGLTLVLSFTFFCSVFFESRKSWIVSILVANFPILFGLGLTLWHDVPMTAGLLIFAAAIKKSRDGDQVSIWVFVVSFVLVNTRFNGFWTVLFSLLILVIARKLSLNSFVRLFLCLALVTSPFMYLNNIHSTNENAQVSGLTHWMKYDISCYLSSAKPDETQFIKRFNREGLAQEDFVSGRACTWFMDPEVLEKWSFIPTQSTFKIWTQLLRSDSFSVFRIHDNRAEYLVFSPFRIPAKPPYLHTNIEYENPWVKEWNPSIYKAARTYPRLWNAISPITSYAGFWWVVILLLTLKNSSYFPIFAISTVLNVSIFVVAIIPDARFVAFTLISGIALITSEFLKLLSKGRDFLRLNQRV